MIKSYPDGQTMPKLFKKPKQFETVNSSFESGWGGWSNGGGDRVWTRYTGSAPSGNTGPTGTQDGSWYMYCETSAGVPVAKHFT